MDANNGLRFDDLFKAARLICEKSGFDDAFALEATLKANTGRERLLAYLREFYFAPIRKDDAAIEIVNDVTEQVEGCKGVSLIFDHSDDPLQGAIPIEEVADRILRVDFRNLIDDLEKSY